MRPRDVEQVRDAAEAVRRQSEGVELAFAAERAANAAAIRAVLDAAEPCLPSLFSRIRALACWEAPPAFALASTGPGSIEGATLRRLYVLEAGEAVSLAEVIFAGLRPVSFSPVSVEEAATRYRAEDVAAEVLAACARQLEGNAGKRATEARQRAERLRALATLVEAIAPRRSS